MDGGFAICSDDERIFKDEESEEDASEEEFGPGLDRVARERVALRDRLITRVFEEELLALARLSGQESLAWIGFEVDPLRLWNRLGLDHRSSFIRARIMRVNRLPELGLEPGQHIDPSTKNTALLTYLQAIRHDWQRGKVTQRHNDRLRRERQNRPSEEDRLWLRIR